ncbi:MAG: hypothetical protein KBD50_04020 [Candidatus Pacebacteria bacterium]|nr:hypothetical protein [Candidatus Paceibacterota bacterium]
MVSVLTVTLGVSIVGLFSLLALKRREMRTGRVAFRGLRPRLRRFFHIILVVIEHVIPGLVKHLVHGILRFMRGGVQRVIARAILMFELTLERVLHRVRSTSTAPQGSGEVSNFLQEVAAHKRALLKRAPSKRAIFEE